MKDALVHRFGFQEDRISVLTNLDATREAILTALENLLQWVGENESVILHYSGHGFLKPDGPENDEPDGYDKTLVPCDSGRAPYPNRDITDDEIHAWLQRLMARNPYITLIFDCCHSGTIFRDRTIRGWPRDTQMDSKARLKNREDDRCVFFSACTSTEFASEILVGDSPQVCHGALTYFLVQELMSPSFRGATCIEVFERLRPKLRMRCKEQTPQLKGARNRELFGQATFLPMPFVSVLARKDDYVTLEAGATSGLVRDAPWIVYAPGTRAFDDAAFRLGTVSIVSVGATTSEARVVEETQPGAVIAGARAVERFARLTVDLVVPLGHPAAEKAMVAIGRAHLLALSSPADRVDARISLQPGIDGGETWAVTDGEGRGLLTPELPCSEPEALKTLVGHLESMARLRMLLSISNPGSGLNRLVDFELFRWTPDGCVPAPRDENSEMLFHEGDRLVLQMRNRSSYPLYFYVLDVGLTSRIGMDYPREGSQELLETDQIHQVGFREGEELILYLPAGFDRLPDTVRGDRETLKLIVSTGPGEHDLLLQSSQQYRSAWKEDWATIERTFRLLPKASSPPLA